MRRLARRLRTATVTRPGRWWRDERGGTAVQAIVFMPVIFLALVMTMVLWQTVSIRRSLHTGTYLATRYLSLYPIEQVDPLQWSLVAQKFVWAELRNNPFVDETMLNEVFSPVEVTLNAGNECSAEFLVTARYTLFAPLNATESRFLPAIEWFPIEDVRTGKVMCP